MSIFLHDHKEFPALLRIIEEETGILASLVEKDYWIMHCLYGLQVQGYDFQLKGGTSLSKGFGIIHRFSEDIDLHIDPPIELGSMKIPTTAIKKISKKRRLITTRSPRKFQSLESLASSETQPLTMKKNITAAGSD